MFLIVFSISFPLDEGVGHTVSITGTLLHSLVPGQSLELSYLSEQCSDTLRSYGVQLHCTLGIHSSVSRVVYQHCPVYLYAYGIDCSAAWYVSALCLRFGMGFVFVCLCQKDFSSRLVGMMIQLDARSSPYE